MNPEDLQIKDSPTESSEKSDGFETDHTVEETVGNVEQSVENQGMIAIEEIEASASEATVSNDDLETILKSVNLENEKVSSIKESINLDNVVSDINAEIASEKQAAIDKVREIVATDSPVESTPQAKPDSFQETILKQRDAGYEKIFEESQELSSIGSKEEYLEYLKSKFPAEIGNKLDGDYIQTGINSFLENINTEENVEEVEKKFLSHYVTLATKEEYEKTMPYLGADSTTINGMLRNGKEINVNNIIEHEHQQDNASNELVLDSANKIVEGYHTLQEVINKSYWAVNQPLFNNSKTYRVDFTNNHEGVNVGDVVSDKAFLSTSITKNALAKSNFEKAGDSTILIMNFPKNSIVNAFCLGGSTSEVVFPPNMAYEIKNKKLVEVNGSKKTILDVEFLPNEYLHVLGSQKDIEDFRKFVFEKKPNDEASSEE